jgi:large subunit ribosomal protein L35
MRHTRGEPKHSPHKWLGANKDGIGFPYASRAQARRSIDMPKMKTKSAAKKRFRVRPGGTVKRGHAFKRHILTKKTTKNKRHLRGSTAVHETNMGHMAQMLPGRGI